MIPRNEDVEDDDVDAGVRSPPAPEAEGGGGVRRRRLLLSTTTMMILFIVAIMAPSSRRGRGYGGALLPLGRGRPVPATPSAGHTD